ncbi:MAG TPA: HAMP domain-containing sensor histidine kinase [Byssovorax sp.]
MRSDREAEGSVSRLALTEMLTHLAHDLRTPLGVLNQALADIRGAPDLPLSDEQRRVLALADRAARRIAHVADLLSLAAAIEGGKLEHRRAMLDLGAILDAAVKAARALEPRREVDVESAIPDMRCTCEADADHIARGLAEMTSNAIRHARSRVRVTLSWTAESATIEIEDDGQGVAEDRRETLFERLASAAPRARGLGLSIAHDLIRANGGAITLADSTLPPGRVGTRGARFVTSLPLVAAR